MPASPAPQTRPIARPLTAEHRRQVLEEVGAALERLSYGSVALTVHDGRVVQIEVTERKRLP